MNSAIKGKAEKFTPGKWVRAAVYKTSSCHFYQNDRNWDFIAKLRRSKQRLYRGAC